MKRVLLALCVLALAGELVACQPDPHAERRASMDDAIHEMEHDVAAFYMLGHDASVSEIRSATDRLSATWDKMEESAVGLEDIDLSEAAAAHQELVSTVEALPEQAQDSQSMQTVIPKVEAFKLAIDELHGAGHFHE